MSVLCVIPARYGSKRFPGKALASETGRPLIQHVYEVATGARRVDRVVLATDDARIAEAARGFGAPVVMTRPDHPCGTNRAAEVAAGAPEAHLVINLQADEPEFPPALLDRLVEAMEADPAIEAATLAGPLGAGGAADPNAVKVAVAATGDALYFSRAAIPYARDGEPARRAPLRLHLGVYGYRAAALARYARLAPSPLELTERLEQLRWLEHGGRMRVIVTDHAPLSIDTQEDYAAFVKRCRGALT